MFDQFRNLAGLMGQAKEMRAKMEQIQAELGRKTVEGEAGAGAVRVRMNGKFEVLAVKLDQPMLQVLAGVGASADVELIEELIAGAMNNAMEKARELVQKEMAALTGGLDIPGIDKLIGGGG